MKGKNRQFKRWTSSFMAALLLIGTFLPSSLIGRAHAEQADHVVISQVYGGGGNASAPYNKDFIELYNPTEQPVDLTGWSVQYASASGISWGVTPLAGTIQAHGYYLISEGGGTNGVDLPTPDASGAIALSGTSGKVALIKDKTTAASGAKPESTIDFVGFGGANAFEGLGGTKAPSNTTSAQRRPYANVDPAPGKGNAWDTDDNAADFTTAAPTPRNTASPTEAPMVPVTSLQPKGLNIQFLQDGTSAKVIGKPEAAEPGSTVIAYETAAKGTALGIATAAADGSFEININKTLTSVYVAATQKGLDESAAIHISVAAPSTPITQAKLSYAVSNGVGTLIGGTGAASANAIINVYPNEIATASEKLNKQDVTAGTSGDFNITINNAPNTVYVTQTTSSAKGIMLQSTPVSVTKADTTAVSKIAEVRTSDAKGQPVNLNQYFTIEGVATVDNQILGTQKQNFYVQDDTAGINIFNTSLDLGYQILKGDKVRITGKVLVYNGLTEFEPT
ncbi:lamin tail domain-containing protein [Bacillus sp. ISL-18]|uniref:lamin tail domain-containing protein n=1 Tax=Bacillus sp. ISL-18 TaxID=2819118 RepID=UPI001BE9085F|nr:lamin tail domain-containing protein [Bacillus sp. ISL-18]MBT2658649.1 lamin tail domain-containing protein [Bacillus sp. ISL-18]